METVLIVAASRERDPVRPKFIPALLCGLVGGDGCIRGGGGGR